MYVRDVLLSDPVTTTPEEPFGALIKRLTNRRQATAVVLDAGSRVVGLVGIHEILRKIVPHYVDLDDKLMEILHEGYFEERLDRLKDTHVNDVMTREWNGVALDDALIKAVALIIEKHRNTLPVIDNGRFVGVVTRRHLLERVVAKWIAADPERTADLTDD